MIERQCSCLDRYCVSAIPDDFHAACERQRQFLEVFLACRNPSTPVPRQYQINSQRKSVYLSA